MEPRPAVAMERRSRAFDLVALWRERDAGASIQEAE